MAQSTNSVSTDDHSLPVCDATPSVHSESEGYDVTRFFDGSRLSPPRFVPSQDGQMVLNKKASVFHQQDKLLVSWLLPTISGSLQSCFTDVRTSNDVWTTANRMFVAISDSKRVEIVLAGLSSEYDAVVTLVSFSFKPFPLRQLIDVPLDFENRQQCMVDETSYHANLAESTPSSASMMVDSSKSVRSSLGGRGRDFKSRVQCQICGHFGHLAQRCFYRPTANHVQSGDSGPRLQYGVGPHVSSRVGYGNSGSCVSNLGINMPIARNLDQRALIGQQMY
ncbi:hypothetical protein J1N35_010736 [Gossypium stocksii]|uniref:CCHC-type domain-containing protein n=1 Tax=Gossypium stocksii TaxID=47602 RepID=A0A9D3W2W7_9ROSI|nr:hypothetical protein J1N35_010736 [Gossypium stocksii]